MNDGRDDRPLAPVAAKLVSCHRCIIQWLHIITIPELALSIAVLRVR